MHLRKKRLSSEYRMLSILEYLYNNNSQKTPISKFNIVTRTPGIKRQRPDRVNLMMDSRMNLNLALVKSIQLPVPPMEEQRKIISYLSCLDRWIEKEINYKAILLLLKKGLMQNLLTGKIRVKV